MNLLTKDKAIAIQRYARQDHFKTLLNKIMVKKIPTLRLVFLFLVGPPGLEPGTKGL
jgi:hypothetical protein